MRPAVQGISHCVSYVNEKGQSSQALSPNPAKPELDCRLLIGDLRYRSAQSLDILPAMTDIEPSDHNQLTKGGTGMTDQEIYEKWVEYMTNGNMTFTENEHRMRMVTTFLTPEEAAFTTGFPLSAKTIEEIAEIKQMDIPELKEKIEALARRGIVYESIRGDSVRYRMWSFGEIFMRVPLWPGKDEEPIKTTSHHGNKYYPSQYAGRKAPPHAGLRSLPIHETVDSPSQLLPFEDVLKVVDKYEFYSVSHCCCRMRYDLDPDYPETPFPTEVCLHFDELGRYIVKNDLGREITKEETLEILKKAADAGLVHGLQNTEEAAETICNCDVEHCTFIKPYHQFGFDKAMDQSNYAVQVTPETCKACGLCVKRCPMDAIQMKFSPKSTNKFRKAVVVDTDICIGCGVCVHKCPAESLVLERKETITRPPKTGRDLARINFMAMMAEREKAERSHQSGTD